MTLDQIKAVMIGHAVGDALGVPVEFKTPEYIAKDPVTGMRGYGSYAVPAGAWSDDTSMSLCALAAMGRKDWTFEEVMDNFFAWMSDNRFTATDETFDVGYTCFNAILNYRQNGMPVSACGLYDEDSNGNGSLMRIHPFSLLVDTETAEWESVIDQASALTHGHDRSKLACRIYTMILSALLDNPDKNAVFFALLQADCRYRSHPEHRHFRRLFAMDFEDTPLTAIKSTGYVVDTLEAAVWCLLTTDSYEECVLKAVNLGEDTDTVAAVAGGLAGALYGYDAIPLSWRTTLKRRQDIEDLCAAFHRAHFI